MILKIYKFDKVNGQIINNRKRTRKPAVPADVAIKNPKGIGGLIVQEQMAQQSRQSEQHCVLASQLIYEISVSLETIINHSVRRTLNEQYAQLLDSNSQYQRDFEQLKEKVLRLSIRFPHEEISAIKMRHTRQVCWSSDKLPEHADSFDESLDQDPFEHIANR